MSAGRNGTGQRTAVDEKTEVDVVRELLTIGRDHNRYDAIRNACMVVHGENVTAQAERTLT